MRTEFQEILNKELSKRIHKNPAYSLRAFAKHLEVSPSALSAMMSGKRPITKKSIELLGLRLGLSAKKVSSILLQINFKQSELSRKGIQFQELMNNQMSVLSDWYNLAILELMKLEDFEPSEKYVSKKLGITVFEARGAIDCLKQNNILEIKSDGTWVDRYNGFTQSLPKEKTTTIKKRLQQQFFEKALNAISDVDYSRRDHTGTTMAIAEEDLPMVRELITKFRRELSKLLDGRENLNQVYQLSIGFFPLTKELNNNNGSNTKEEK
ncbi:MAG: TIGR02147 family protein [Bdellovibrionota bacterium]